MPQPLGLARRHRTRSQTKSIRINNTKCALNNAPKVVIKIMPDLGPRPITRGFAKILNHKRDFIIVEIYRCMPLLGDEEKQAPDWTVHIVRYDIVFIDNQCSV